MDTALVGALHVEYLKKRDLGEEARPHHTLFQTSTIDALLQGEYERATSRSSKAEGISVWVRSTRSTER